MAYFTLALESISSEQSSYFKVLAKSTLIQQIVPSITTALLRRFCIKPRQLNTADKMVLKQHCTTVVAPKVASVAQGLFSQSLHVADMVAAQSIQTPVSACHRVHPKDPGFVKWGDHASKEGFYRSVLIDGTTYTVCKHVFL